MVDEDFAERAVVAELLFEHRDRNVLRVNVGVGLQQLTEQRNLVRIQLRLVRIERITWMASVRRRRPTPRPRCTGGS